MTQNNRRSHALKPLLVVEGPRSLAKFRVHAGVGADRERAAADAATTALLPRLRGSPFDLIVCSLSDSSQASALVAGSVRPRDLVPMLETRLGACISGVAAALSRGGLALTHIEFAICDDPQPGVWVDFTYSKKGLN